MEFEKKIVVLGSTGSIGTQTLEIAREYKGIKIEAMSAHSNIDLIEKQESLNRKRCALPMKKRLRI